MSHEQAKEEQAMKAAEEEAIQNEDNGGSSSSSEEEEELATFSSDEEAVAARSVAVKLYNEGKLAEALSLQLALLHYFTKKNDGEMGKSCGLYYLDYGLTLLSVIQNTAPEDAAMAGATQDDLETCFNVLDAARVCLEKQDAETPEDCEVQSRLAEVHNALGMVHVEMDQSEEALAEYETELLLLNGIKDADEFIGRRKVACQFQAANCFMAERDYENAVGRFEAALEAAKSCTGLRPEMLEDIKQYLEEAQNMKGDKFEVIKEEIHGMFPDESSQVKDIDTFNKEHPSPGKSNGQPAAAPAAAANSNPFMQALPTENAGSNGLGGGVFGNIPLSLQTPIPPRENSNSNSMSFFPRQGSGNNSLSAGGPVNVVVPVKKKRHADASQGDVEPAAKKAKTEH